MPLQLAVRHIARTRRPQMSQLANSRKNKQAAGLNSIAMRAPTNMITTRLVPASAEFDLHERVRKTLYVTVADVLPQGKPRPGCSVACYISSPVFPGVTLPMLNYLYTFHARPCITMPLGMKLRTLSVGF
jgi:hypothetical protein